MSTPADAMLGAVGLGIASDRNQIAREDIQFADQARRRAFVGEQLNGALQQMTTAMQPLVAMGRLDVAESVGKQYAAGFEEIARTLDKIQPGEGDMIRRIGNSAIQSALAQPTAQDTATASGQASAAQEQANAQALGIQPPSVVAQQQELARTALLGAQRQSEIALAQKYAQEIALGNALKSDLIDERGGLKSEVSQDLFRMATSHVNPLATANPQTGLIEGLTQEQVVLAQRLATTAADLIEKGLVRNENQAMLVAQGVIEIPKADAVVPLTPDKRQELLDQNATIALLAPSAKDLISKAPLATGLSSAGQAGIDATLGQGLEFFGIRDQPLFEDTQQARDDIARFNQVIAQVLVNNPRFPEWERNMINGLLVDPNEWFANPARAREKMENLFAHMQTRLQNNRDILSGKAPGGVPTVVTPSSIEAGSSPAASASPSAAPSAVPSAELPIVGSREAYDAIPDGAQYRLEDGSVWRKGPAK